jgi:DNA-binding transcriptional LysR family regulator
MKTTLRQMEVFLSVARTGSVSRSAADLLLSQSAVSMSLAELERILGGSLFDRSKKRLHLNDRGRLFLPRAMEICDRVEEAEDLLRAPEKGKAKGGSSQALSGRLKIAASSTVGNYLIPRIMGAFVERNPGVHLSLEVKNSSEVIRSVLQFECDAGFVEGIVHDPELEVGAWRRDRMVVIASPNHPLGKKRSVRPADLERVGWIMREPGSGTREILENALSGIVKNIKVLLELGNTEAIKNAVEGSRAVSSLSHVTVSNDIAHGRLLELRTPFLDLERNFYLVVHRDKYRTSLLGAFLDFAEEGSQESGG